MTEEDAFSSDHSSEESEEANEEPVAGRVGAPPKVAVELGFTQNPIPYVSMGQYSAKAGAKLQQPDMSEFDALRRLVTKPLLRALRTRAEAYFAANNLGAEYDADGVWRYWAAVIAHGIVQYSREEDAYVAEKSSVGGMLGNGLLRRLHSRAQWQHAKQAWTAPRDAWTDHFNSRARELWVLTQQQAVDEGGIPTFANISEQKYTPGKPHRNAVEFFAAVGSDLWLSNMMWSADKRAKYGTPERKLSQMQAYVRYFREYHSPDLQPHILYIDARWSSLALMDHIAASRCYGVLSCSAGMRPKALIPWMKNGLNKGDWWSIGYIPANANLVTIRTKKKVYLNLLTNYASLASVTMRKQRRKYPREQYNVRAPFVQKNYNEYKCGVDKWNRALLEYYRSGFFINSDVMYSTFFIHAFTLQSWTYWKGVTNTDCSQLSFRKRLVQQLCGYLFPEPPEQALVQKHWPVKMTGSHRCQYRPCRNMCNHKCSACEKWGCLSCLRNAHIGS